MRRARAVSGSPSEGRGDGVAVHAGQADVADDGVGVAALGLGDTLEPVDGDADLVAVQPQQPAKALGGIGVVLDDQDAQADRGPRGDPTGFLLPTRPPRRGGGGRRTRPRGPRRRCWPDRAAVQLDDAPDQRQTQAQAAPGRRRGFPSGRASASSSRSRASGAMPTPVSRTASARMGSVRVGEDLERDRAAATGEFHGVVQQAVHDPTEPRGVRPHPDLRRHGAPSTGSRRVGPRRPDGPRSPRRPTRRRSTGSRLQRDQPAGKPGDLQHVVNDPRQAVNLAIHHFVQVGGEAGIAQARDAAGAGCCGSGPADCAARVPAGPAGRPSAARLVHGDEHVVAKLAARAGERGQVARSRGAKPRTAPSGPRRAVIVTSAQNREPAFPARQPDRAIAPGPARHPGTDAGRAPRAGTSASDRPTTSSARRPVSCSAPAFHVRMLPAGSTEDDRHILDAIDQQSEITLVRLRLRCLLPILVELHVSPRSGPDQRPGAPESNLRITLSLRNRPSREVIAESGPGTGAAAWLLEARAACCSTAARIPANIIGVHREVHPSRPAVHRPQRRRAILLVSPGRKIYRSRRKLIAGSRAVNPFDHPGNPPPICNRAEPRRPRSSDGRALAALQHSANLGPIFQRN